MQKIEALVRLVTKYACTDSGRFAIESTRAFKH